MNSFRRVPFLFLSNLAVALLLSTLPNHDAHAVESRLPNCLPGVLYKDKCFGTFVFVRMSGNNLEYTGEWLAGERHGQGTEVDSAGNKYVGEWKSGKKNGFGTWFSADGRVLQRGIYRDNKFIQSADASEVPSPSNQDSRYPNPCPVNTDVVWTNCFGKFTNDDKGVYEGYWVDDKYNGRGTYTAPNGVRFVGEFKDNEPNGLGTVYFQDGKRWVGEFKDGNRHGRGTLYAADGRVEESGIYKDDELVRTDNAPIPPDNSNQDRLNRNPCPRSTDMVWTDCFGRYTYEDGSIYEGFFIEDKRNGQGTNTWPDGAKYVGWFKDDNKHGQGTLTLADGEKYVGEFKEDKRNGQGTNTWPDGETFAGQWQSDYPISGVRSIPSSEGTQRFEGSFDSEGLLTGIGKWSSTDSEGTHEYQGNFEAGNFEGRGTFVFPDGRKYVGQFRKDQFSGQGTLTYADGSKYVGQFRDDAFNGRGVLYAPDGRVTQQGEFKDGQLVGRNDVKPPSPVEPVTPEPVTPDMTWGKRVALVIGNGAYSSVPLANATNDSGDIATVLRSRGFQVIEKKNLSLKGMRDALREFRSQISSSTAALFYFSGHGMEYAGRNYLLPVDADLQDDFDLQSVALDANSVLEIFNVQESSADRVNMMILDACRSPPPVRSSSRSLTRGLVRVEAPSGTLVAYSTSPGMLALDGAAGSRNSPYTKHLISALKMKEQKVEEIFKTVRKAVYAETKGKQIPWEQNSLIGDFYFNR